MSETIRCTECNKPLDKNKIVWLQLSNSQGRYFFKNVDLLEEDNQGGFPFGSACALKIGYARQSDYKPEL